MCLLARTDWFLTEFVNFIQHEDLLCCTQVYKGRLRSTGETVAVKIQRPGIGETIAVDMLLLRRLMGAVDRNLPQISQPLVPLVDEFAARLFAELDYVAEGRNCEKFQELYGGMPRVRTPKIYWASTARRWVGGWFREG